MDLVHDDDANLGDDGLPPGRDCPVCGLALEPGHIDSSLTLVWLCANHGMIDITTDPFKTG